MHTFSNGVCKIYLNGILTATQGCITPSSVNRLYCYVGKSNWVADPNINAYLDELRIYNRSLDATEINELMIYAPNSSAVNNGSIIAASLLGLQNYWKFNNDVNDVIGGANLYNGYSASFVADRFGNLNSALNLSLGFYQAPAGVYFRGEHTVSVWVFMMAFSSWARIIDFGNGASNDNIFISPSSGGNCPVTAVYSSSTCSGFLTSNIPLRLNTWTHLVHTYAGGGCRVYLNGTLANSGPCVAPSSVNRLYCYVGKSNWATDPYLNAYLDDLRIYNRSLNSNEVNQLLAFSENLLTTTTSTTTTTSSSTSTTSTTTSTTTTTTTTSTTTSTTSSSTSSTTSSTSTSTTTTQTSTTSTSTSTTTTSSTSSSSSTTSTSTSTTTTTTLTTTTSYSIINIILSLNSTFDLVQLDPTQTIELLNSNYDLSGCIVNCTNNGQCKFDSINTKFICSCFSNYMSGYACQIDTRPCSSNPCLNNATCVDYSNSGNNSMAALLGTNSSSFYCSCGKYYKGTYCESKIDLCQNETCSNNGNCFEFNNMPKCKCFSMYSGDKCETQSSELKNVKTIISYTTILAIITIVLFYSSFILMDATKYSFKKNNILPIQPKETVIMKKYSYIP